MKTKYDRGETINGEKVVGDRARLSLYPPQPEPRITTRSRFLSLWEMAAEWSAWDAGSLLVAENAWRRWLILGGLAGRARLVYVVEHGLPSERIALIAMPLRVLPGVFLTGVSTPEQKNKKAVGLHTDTTLTSYKNCPMR